jgi:Family of unknown function (DUF6510)
MATDPFTDGNDVAGLLAEFSAAEMTSAHRRCQACQGEHPLGAHRAYHGAAVVLRCPGCGAVAVRLGAFGDQLVVEWHGTYRAPRVA